MSTCYCCGNNEAETEGLCSYCYNEMRRTFDEQAEDEEKLGMLHYACDYFGIDPTWLDPWVYQSKLVYDPKSDPGEQWLSIIEKGDLKVKVDGFMIDLPTFGWPTQALPALVIASGSSLNIYFKKIKKEDETK